MFHVVYIEPLELLKTVFHNRRPQWLRRRRRWSWTEMRSAAFQFRRLTKIYSFWVFFAHWWRTTAQKSYSNWEFEFCCRNLELCERERCCARSITYLISPNSLRYSIGTGPRLDLRSLLLPLSRQLKWGTIAAIVYILASYWRVFGWERKGLR